MRSILKALIAGAVLAPVAASAGSDVLIRQIVPSFATCVAVQDEMMRNLGVEPAALSVEVDTGAMLERVYVSESADLVLICNRVTDLLEVRRVTSDGPREEVSLEAAPLVDEAPAVKAGEL